MILAFFRAPLLTTRSTISAKLKQIFSTAFSVVGFLFPLSAPCTLRISSRSTSNAPPCSRSQLEISHFFLFWQSFRPLFRTPPVVSASGHLLPILVAVLSCTRAKKSTTVHFSFIYQHLAGFKLDSPDTLSDLQKQSATVYGMQYVCPNALQKIADRSKQQFFCQVHTLQRPHGE